MHDDARALRVAEAIAFGEYEAGLDADEADVAWFVALPEAVQNFALVRSVRMQAVGSKVLAGVELSDREDLAWDKTPGEVRAVISTMIETPGAIRDPLALLKQLAAQRTKKPKGPPS